MNGPKAECCSVRPSIAHCAPRAIVDDIVHESGPSMPCLRMRIINPSACSDLALLPRCLDAGGTRSRPQPLGMLGVCPSLSIRIGEICKYFGAPSAAMVLFNLVMLPPKCTSMSTPAPMAMHASSSL